MDIGMIIGFVGAVTGIIALVLSIINLLYTRRRTKIMEEQLSITREEKEKKGAFEEVSKAIRQAINKIKKYADAEYFSFPVLEDFSGADILSHLHDNQLKTLKLHIKPQGLKFYTENEPHLVKIEKIKDLMEKTKKTAESEGYIFLFHEFSCDPNILQNSYIELGDAFHAISGLYHAHKILEPYAYLIDAFDNTVLDEFEQTIDNIVKVIFESLMSEHEITFRAIDKTAEITMKLKDEIVGLRSIEKLLRKLSSEIRDQRLMRIQKEMFLKT